MSSLHHCSGSCSAKPGALEIIDISFEGENAEATGEPDPISNKAVFTEDEPISIPRRYLASMF
jgi:hypothetical protein